MIVGGCLCESQQFVRGYFLISIATQPPIMCFIITVTEFWIISELAASHPHEKSEQQNVEFNEQDEV